jgi:DNA ligase-1
VKAFAELLDRLVFMASRNGKLRLLDDYFRAVPDPDRGYALAALAGELDFPGAKPALVRGLAGPGSTRCCLPGPTITWGTWPRPWR